MHVHVSHPDGEAKFWLEPQLELATSQGLKAKQLAYIVQLITARRMEIDDAWRKHFSC